MSFTYNNTLATDLDTVRFYIGDTDSSDIILQNEEINAVLVIETNVYRAAAECALVISNLYAKKVDESIGDHSKSYSQLSTQYQDLALRLRAKTAKNVAFTLASDLDQVFTKDLP